MRGRHILRRDEQLALMTMAHFPEVIACARGERIEALCCAECMDYQNESCLGEGLEGWDCIGCMDTKISQGEKFIIVG